MTCFVPPFHFILAGSQQCWFKSEKTLHIQVYFGVSLVEISDVIYFPQRNTNRVTKLLKKNQKKYTKKTHKKNNKKKQERTPSPQSFLEYFTQCYIRAKTSIRVPWDGKGPSSSIFSNTSWTSLGDQPATTFKKQVSEHPNSINMFSHFSMEGWQESRNCTIYLCPVKGLGMGSWKIGWVGGMGDLG